MLLKQRLYNNNESKSLNKTYLNIIKIFNNLFKKLNIIKLRNLVVTSTRKKGNFKFMGKITSVTGKSKYCSRVFLTVAVAENNKQQK